MNCMENMKHLQGPTDLKTQVSKTLLLQSVLKEIFEESPIVLQVAGGTFHGAASDFLDKIKALKNVFH